MQDLDAQRRMQILRGEIPTPLAIEDAPQPSDSSGQNGKRAERGDGSTRERKRRKKTGENDTDFEMRVAREDRDKVAEIGNQLVLRKETEAPLVDHRGHIDLFPQPKPEPSKVVEKNAEAERETARKRKEYEDQYTMRFSNAAGFKQGLENPWYSKTGTREEDVGEVVGKDVWGNEDPRRKERESRRIIDNDPLAMMKAGARQVREVKRERERWREEKEREVKELEDVESRKRKKRRYEESEDEDDLEGFRLDGREERPSSLKRREGRESERDRERRHRHHKESRRSSHREREREEGRHRHRHRSRHHD